MDPLRQYLIDEELEYYRDGRIDRRAFLRRAAQLGLGAAAAITLSNTVSPRPAAASTQAPSPDSVAADDPAIFIERSVFAATDGAPLTIYVARPAGETAEHSLPGVYVCHENRGLTPQIQDVVRRYAKQGYFGMGIDLLSRVGPPAEELPDVEAVAAAQARLDSEQVTQDAVAGIEYLKFHRLVDESKLAATGFCFGGGVIWRLATRSPYLKAAAPFYGANPPLQDVPNIKAAMFGVYAGLDARLNEGVAILEGRGALLWGEPSPTGRAEHQSGYVWSVCRPGRAPQ